MRPTKKMRDFIDVDWGKRAHRELIVLKYSAEDFSEVILKVCGLKAPPEYADSTNFLDDRIQRWLDTGGHKRRLEVQAAYARVEQHLKTLAERVTVLAPLVERRSDPPVTKWTHQVRCQVARLEHEIDKCAGPIMWWGPDGPPFGAGHLAQVHWSREAEKELAALTAFLFAVVIYCDEGARPLAELTVQQRTALQFITQKGPLLGKDLAKLLDVTEGHLRSRIIPALVPHGVYNAGDKQGYALKNT